MSKGESPGGNETAARWKWRSAGPLRGALAAILGVPLFLCGLVMVAGFVLLFEESTPGDLYVGFVVSVLTVGGGSLLVLIA